MATCMSSVCDNDVVILLCKEAETQQAIIHSRESILATNTLPVGMPSSPDYVPQDYEKIKVYQLQIKSWIKLQPKLSIKITGLYWH